MTELSQILKDLPSQVLNLPIEERPILYENISAILKKPEINSSIIRGICKVIGSTLIKYKDAGSQQLVRKLIIDLLHIHHDSAIEHLNSVFKVLANKELPNAPISRAAKAAAIALSWTILVIKHADHNSNVFHKEWPRLLEFQIALYQYTLFSSAQVSEKVDQLFFEIMKEEHTFQKYFTCALKKECTISLTLFLMLLVRYKEMDGRLLYFDVYKNELIDHFVNSIVISKIKPHLNHVIACRPLLHMVTENDFEAKIYPNMQKAMLRNPENILNAVGIIVTEINLEFSSYASQLGKVLIQNLYSKEETSRHESVDSLKLLSQKCSKASAIEGLIKLIFSILNGSDGKITVAEYRMNLLQGAGNLSFNAIHRDELTNVMELVTNLFAKTLETEIQEKVICHSLEMFSLWTMKLRGELPQTLTNIFKKGLSMKTTTQLVRLSYLQWLVSSLDNCFLNYDPNINSILMATLNKAYQTPTQIFVLSEAICAACIIFKTDKSDLDDSLSSFWNNILDMNKQIFFAERFLHNALPETLCFVAQLSQRLLIQYLKQIKGSTNVIYKTIFYTLMSSYSKVRSCSVTLIQPIIKSSIGSTFSIQMFEQFKLNIDNLKIQGTDSNLEECSIPSCDVVNIIKNLCTFENLSDHDSQALALNSLLICHHPDIFCDQKNLWENILRDNLKLDPKKYISLNYLAISNLLLNNFKKKPIFENAIITVTNLSPDVFLPCVISKVINDINELVEKKVTEEEYLVYQSSCDLYDKTAIPNDENIYLLTGLKRENIYKDQIEELHIRREIEEKRKKEMKVKQQTSTNKQQEAIKNQIEKETIIKIRLSELNDKLENVIAILESVCNGNVKQMSIFFCDLLSLILQLLKSPLAASPTSKLYIYLGTKCFNDEHIGDLIHQIGVTTIRMEKPHCELENSWLKKDLDQAIVETLINLHQVTVDKSNENDPIDRQVFLNVPLFSYCFEFLKRALQNHCILSNEEFLLLGIQIIENHAHTRGKTISGEIFDYHHPKYMPRLEIFILLLQLITENRGRAQTQAVATLLESANLSSGIDFCALAGVDEIGELLCALENRIDATRDAALRALKIMYRALKLHREEKKTSILINKRLWIAKFDVNLEIRTLANELWELCELKEPNSDEIIEDVMHPELCIQKAASLSLIPLLAQKNAVERILNQLLIVYNEKLAFIPPKVDQFDREIEPAIDQWKPRRGIAIAISYISSMFDIEDVNKIMQFMVSQGLGDREEIVHKEMLAAALAIVDVHGKETIIHLLPVFENFLDKAPKSQSFDNIRQAVVILMGSLARHLEKDDPRIEPIVRRLLSALSTPSQQVQEAVSNCLPHLMPSIKDEAPAMIKRLMQLLVKSEKYGERRGAAYGIAGVVKGLGILSLKQFDIMSKLTICIQEKKNYKSREGALFAFEVLCTKLGRLFEPYIVHVLPHLLQCFGDSSQYVRQAADDTAKVVMGKLSAHGVKLVLPSLLEALDQDSWRTKTASVELLGAMAFCAPKQLSSCLPSIVPKLIEVLGDSHTKVQEAGTAALKVIGSVIKNPEIQAIVEVLLKALEDPSKNTSSCLHTLLQTKFVHFIDAPSLALIMPVVQRAFMDRSTETRKMAAQIIGNMYSLTDQKDLTPYLPSIVPGLKMSLLDPVPEVRAVSARALGAMVRGMGESAFEDLLPWLMQTLTSETSSVDRSGAAQGFAEVVGGLGVEKLQKLMPEIISTAERSDIAPHVKDGYIMMFIYMPGAFPDEFTVFIGQIINPILKALADENEFVRDTALKAGQRIINLYAESAVTLLLPELEKGLFDDNWRIRLSSVQLLGDLLYRISGVSGKMTTETASEDDNFGTEQSHMAIIRLLGDERRNRVLSGLYMGRSDVSLMVRQAALHVWKVVVTNTPRTLREILPTLFNLLLGCLASTSYDKRQVAARTLGDLVRKLGERVLPEIIPILENGLNSNQPDQRQGVCIGLSEIMASTSKEMILIFVNSLVPTVRKALSDPLPEVREAAAKTFESLHTTVGSRALDDILPSMLEGLSDSDNLVAENTLDGLRQVMAIKPKVVLPYLIPHITTAPINTKALSILVSVAGEALTKYLPKILSALLLALSEAQGTPNEIQELEYCQVVILSVTDDAGMRTIMDTLIMSARSEEISTRRSVASLLSTFCTHSSGDYSQYIPQLFRCLLLLLADTDKDILQRSWDALNAVVKTMDAAQHVAHVSDVRQAVRYAASDLKYPELPGFCLPKGITPLLPVFREAILNGLPEEKESAAQGLGEIITLTSAQSLQPSVVHITGPLIRILGDRFNAGVKAAVLQTLAILLHKVGIMLKQFLPQLQTTFLKSLHDQNRTVRMKAGHALSKLVIIHTRVDPIFVEIHTSLKNTDDSSFRETLLQALRNIISTAGNKMSENLGKQVSRSLLSMLSHHEDLTRNAVGGCIGALLKHLPQTEVDDILENYILSGNEEDILLKHGKSVVIFVAFKESSSMLLNSNCKDKVISIIIANSLSEKVPIASNGVRALMYFILNNLSNNILPPQTIMQAFIRSMNHNSNEVKQLVAKSCNHLAKVIPAEKMSMVLIKHLIPMLVNGTKEKNGYVKSNSEIALVSILRLRENETIYIKTIEMLDSGAKDSLSEVASKVLRKVALQPIGKEEELDDTILT